MRWKNLYTMLIALLSVVCSAKGQNLFHQDIFNGGVTAGGFSAGLGAGSGVVELHIEPGSTIRKAYLFSYTMGYPPPTPITVNNVPYIFDTLNCIMSATHPNPLAVPVRLYFYDVTQDLSASITSTFNVALIPNGSNLPLNTGWWTAFLYIEYENPALPKVATAVWVNDKNYVGSEAYQMTGMNPIDTNFPVGLSLYTDRVSPANGIEVRVNNSMIGTVFGTDNVNASWSGGVKGHFYYQNNALFGLDDDTPDASMSNSDGLADISSYLLNNTISYNLDLTHEILPLISPGHKCLSFLFINAYSTPCDIFSTSIINHQEICKGESIQLSASGGVNYYWTPQAGLSNPNIGNPVAEPDSSTWYVVRIENTQGCSRTERVFVKVNEPLVISNIAIQPTACGSETGRLTITAQGETPFQYSIGNGFQTSNVFNNLPTGNYIITVLDDNGCSTDTTAFVPEVNQVNAFFTSTPDSGNEPLEVQLTNGSAGSNHYNWYVDDVFYSSAFNAEYTFGSSGVYEVMLIAYNNIPECADTFSIQIIVHDSFKVEIPNVFTPNGDGINDIFSIKVKGTSTIEAFIHDRWGGLVYEYSDAVVESPALITLWNGRAANNEKASEGVYYYILRLTDRDGKEYSYSGAIHLNR